MIRSSLPWSWSGPLAAALAWNLSACTPPPPPSPQVRAAEATVNACRQRADQVYKRQNRGSLYTENDRDLPESTDYLPGITTRGLAERYQWDTQVSDCVNQGPGGGVAPGFSPGPSPVTGAGTSLGPAR